MSRNLDSFPSETNTPSGPRPGRGLEHLTEHSLQQILIKEKVRGALLKGLFKEQLKVVKDPSRLKSVLCSRGAGKTVLGAHVVALELLDAGFKEYVVFGAKTLDQADRLVWPDLRNLIAEHGLESLLGWVVSSSSIKTPSGAEFLTIGLDEQANADKLRGIDIRLAILDEIQSYEHALSNAVDNVIMPRLRGTLMLMGTPGFALAGRWFEISTGIEPGWSCSHWTMLDNPFYPDAQGTIERVMLQKRMSREDPYIQREYLGVWAADASKLVHPHFEVGQLPPDWDLDDPDFVSRNLSNTLSADFGFSPDPSAFIVFAQRHGDPTIYVVHAEKIPRLNDDRFAGVALGLYEQFLPIGMVADVGGGGKSALETFNEKFGDSVGVHMEPAQKTNKRAAIDMLNTYLRTGRIVLVQGLCDELIDEFNHYVWKDDFRKKAVGEHHLCDALLYAFRAHSGGHDIGTKLGQSFLDDEQDAHNEREARRQAAARDPDMWDEDDTYLS